MPFPHAVAGTASTAGLVARIAIVRTGPPFACRPFGLRPAGSSFRSPGPVNANAQEESSEIVAAGCNFGRSVGQAVPGGIRQDQFFTVVVAQTLARLPPRYESGCETLPDSVLCTIDSCVELLKTPPTPLQPP